MVFILLFARNLTRVQMRVRRIQPMESILLQFPQMWWMIQLRLSQRIRWTSPQHRQWSLLVMRTPMIPLPHLTLQPMIQQRLLQQLLHVTARAMKLPLSEKQRKKQQAALKSHQQRKQRWMAKSDRCTIFFIKMFWTHEQDSVFTHASKLGIFFTNNVRYVPG